MKLHGYFKEDFEKWYLNIYLDFSKESEQTKKMMLLIFYKKKFTERYGVYVDFGDSVKLEIDIMSMQGFGFEYYINQRHYGNKDSRHEAREQSIIKLQEIYNDKEKNRIPT